MIHSAEEEHQSHLASEEAILASRGSSLLCAPDGESPLRGYFTSGGRIGDALQNFQYGRGLVSLEDSAKHDRQCNAPCSRKARLRACKTQRSVQASKRAPGNADRAGYRSLQANRKAGGCCVLLNQMLGNCHANSHARPKL